QAPRGERLERLLGEPAVTDVTLLRGPDVVLDAVVAQDAPLLLEDARDRPAPEVLQPLALGGDDPRLECPHLVGALGATFTHVVARQVDQIVARIAVVGKRHRLSELLEHARLERARERLELRARVVDVVLGRHPGALRALQARARYADGRGAGIDDHERARRVRGDELETDAAAARGLAPAVVVRRGEDLAERVRAPRRRE